MEPRGRLLPRHRKRRGSPAPSSDALPWQRACPPPRPHFRSDRRGRHRLPPRRGPDGAGTKGPPPRAGRPWACGQKAPPGCPSPSQNPRSPGLRPRPSALRCRSATPGPALPRDGESARFTGGRAGTAVTEEGFSVQYELNQNQVFIITKNTFLLKTPIFSSYTGEGLPLLRGEARRPRYHPGSLSRVEQQGAGP